MQKLNFPVSWLSVAAKQTSPKQWLKEVTVILFTNVRVDWAQLGGSHLGSMVQLPSSGGWAGVIPSASSPGYPRPGWGWNSWGTSGLPLTLHMVSPHSPMVASRELDFSMGLRNLQKLCDPFHSGLGSHVVSLLSHSGHRGGHRGPPSSSGRGAGSTSW